MASMKIHGAEAIMVAVIFLAAVLPSHASTTVDEPANYYKPTAPAPPPPAPYSSPPPQVQPVIVVHGVIYCKYCRLRGYNSGMEAVYLRSSPTPLCAKPFLPSNPKLGLTLVRDRKATPPRGARGVFHPRPEALMYTPGTGAKCPPPY
nr:unnamed protein product [Digitaria exilis]